MARWIRDGAAEVDAVEVLVPAADPQCGCRMMPEIADSVHGFGTLVTGAFIPESAAEALLRELLGLGAVDVREVAVVRRCLLIVAVDLLRDCDVMASSRGQWKE